MRTVDFVEFSIARSGAELHIDPAGAIVFNEARGRFAAPSAADAVVTVKAAGFVTEIGAIALEGDTWLSEPITGRFSPAPAGFDFDIATVFDPDLGLGPLLDNGLSDIEWIGLVARDGQDRYHLKGLADPDRVEVITATLVRNQEVVLDIWLDPVTAAVREIEFSTVNKGETSGWLLTFDGYGVPVEVSSPPTESG